MTPRATAPGKPLEADLSDDAIAGAVRAAARAGLERWVRRDHPAAELLAAAIVADGGAGSAGADPAVAAAWRRAVTDVATGAARVNLRAMLLLAVVDEVAGAGCLDAAPTPPVPVAGPYLPAGDPWEGWWADDGPRAWPDGWPADRREVLRAVRQLPVGLRVVLILRDAVGLAGDATADILGVGVLQQRDLLESARHGFVGCLDRIRTGAVDDRG